MHPFVSGSKKMDIKNTTYEGQPYGVGPPDTRRYIKVGTRLWLGGRSVLTVFLPWSQTNTYYLEVVGRVPILYLHFLWYRYVHMNVRATNN